MVGRIFRKYGAARYNDWGSVPRTPAPAHGEFPSLMSTRNDESLGWRASPREMSVPARDNPTGSVSTSAGRGDPAAALLYVVSRSGKVLRSEERTPAVVEDDYMEGELEGYIFLGKGGVRIRNDDVGRGRGRGGGNDCPGRSFDGLGLVSWKKKIPFVVWGDEPESLHDVMTSMSWRQVSRRRSSEFRRISADPWADAVFGASLTAESVDPRQLFRSEIWYRIERNYKIGLSQLAFLQLSDPGQQCEPGLREQAARWTAWLLKMLRKTQSRPLQHLLFTMCAAVLPVICCSLARQPWNNRVSDQELCNCVDIVSNAVERSYACFTPTQWGILEEKLAKCRLHRVQVGVLADNDLHRDTIAEKFEDCLYGTSIRRQLESLDLRPTAKEFQERKQPGGSKSTVQLSYALVQRDGVPSLVERALREKLFTPRSRKGDGQEDAGVLVSLICPLLGRRITTPARGRGCTHPSSFDLEGFLEEHAVHAEKKSSLVHPQKKLKRTRGPWCCPICGSDSTWPQLIVDRTLSRILKVLPEDMREIFLLPSGRWHSVWGRMGEDLGMALDSNGNDCGQQCSLTQDNPHSAKEAACDEVDLLCRAYQTWKGGVDDGERGTSERIAFQWDPKSTLALLTGSDGDVVHGPHLSNLPGMRSNTETQGTGSVNKAEVGHLIPDDSAKSPDIGTEFGRQEDAHARKDEHQIGSDPTYQAVGRLTATYNLNEGTHGQLRMGRHKARPKMMTKKD